MAVDCQVGLFINLVGLVFALLINYKGLLNSICLISKRIHKFSLLSLIDDKVQEEWNKTKMIIIEI